MLIGNIIYTCSSGHPILYSEIPIYAEADDYNDILKDKYIIKRGNAKFNGNKILISDLNTLITQKNLNVLDKDINFITYVIPNITKDCGLIFSFDESIEFDIDSNNNKYHMIKIKNNGIIILEKKTGKEIETLQKSDIIFSDYNKMNEYKIIIKYILKKERL